MQSEVMQSEAMQAEAGQAEAVQSEAVQAGTAGAKAAQAGTIRTKLALVEARADAAAALARGLFGPGVAAAACAIGAAPDPWPAEAAALARAVPARRAEFAAGRAAARAAMAALGLPPAAIPMGPDRAPVWPAGVVGSITHADGIALAVAARASAQAALGLDAEPDAPLPEDVAAEILRPAERAACAALPDPGRAARLVFAAKEAAYKAQYPLSGRLLGFAALAVTLGPGPRLEAAFTEAAPPFAAGDRLAGRAARGAGLVLAGFAVGPGRGGP